jgi:NAD(P)H dehydrogenase (quinone)
MFHYLTLLGETMLTRMYVRRVPETLPQEVLTKMHAPPKGDYPIATPDVLTEYNAFLFGIPTRYGNMPAQWKVGLSL